MIDYNRLLFDISSNYFAKDNPLDYLNPQSTGLSEIEKYMLNTSGKDKLNGLHLFDLYKKENLLLPASVAGEYESLGQRYISLLKSDAYQTEFKKMEYARRNGIQSTH